MREVRVHPDDVRLLSGLDRGALDNLIEKWPSGDDSDAARAVGESMMLAAHGTPPPGISDADWATWFSVDRDSVKNLYRKWRALTERNNAEPTEERRGKKARDKGMKKR